MSSATPSSRRLRILSPVLVVLLSLAAGAGPFGQFRILTETLPEGTTNGEYAATLLTANADGPVTFGVGAGQLPTGLELDPATGVITGLPLEVSQFDVTLTADDGVETVQLPLTMKINAAGGGGNSGASLANGDLATGRVGEPYQETLTILNGVGPYLFGSIGLPPGLSLNGRTGEISGTPDSAGTFFLTLSIADRGENDNKVITIMPLNVLPAASDFRFTTVLVDNGEAGTPFQDTILTEGGSGTVRFAATGLPAGLAIDAATGDITGTPTTAGMFEIFLTAVDADGPITTNRRIHIVPSSASGLYWDYSGVPAAIYNVRYERTPPILVAAKGGTTVTYSVVGLPEGMTYDAGTGEIRGTSSDVGVYPVTFRATDDPSGESLVLPVDFIVLPAGGGDARDIAVNLWVSKQKVKTGRPGRDRWKAVFVYNADRRAGRTFDPETDVLQFAIGSRILELGPETLVRAKRGKAKYKAVLEDGTRVKVKVLAAKQLVKLKSARDRIGETLPGTFRSTVVLGGRGYRLDEFLGERGRFRVTSGYRSTAFVVADARLTIRGPGADAAALRLLLADPGFAYESGGEVRLRLLSGDTVLLDKEFTDLVEVTEARAKKTDETGQRLRLADGDPDETNRVTAFLYDTLNGEATVALSGLDLSGLPQDEAHLGVELTVGEKTYFTTVTVFGPKRGAYTTRMPRK